jgi:LysR family transcriptional regulator, regulator for genes of the gallate degradation pathway
MIPLDVPSLRQLRAFEAVARLESVSSAAREVNLSQPGVTQSICALEARLKTRLFERRRSGCYATDLGAILLPRVRRFFDHIRSALIEPVVGGPFTSRQALEAVINKITRPQIRSLIAVAENHSFDAAARRLRISQPSLHRSAKELEGELRRSLYQRTSRGVTTTAQGSELARRFQVAMREIEYGLEEMQAAQGIIVSRIVIGNIPHSGTQILSAAINALLSVHADARVQVVDDHYDVLLSDLRAGKLDILFGVLRRPDWAGDVNEELLFSNRYSVVVRQHHPLAHLRRITLRDLAKHDWVLPARGAPRREAFERVFSGSTHSPRVSIETTSPAIYRNALASSDRITLLSRLEAQHDDSGGSLITLPFDADDLLRNDGVATRADWQPTRIHRQFLDFLRQETRELRTVDGGTSSARNSRSRIT